MVSKTHWSNYDPVHEYYLDGFYLVAKWDGKGWNYSVGVIRERNLYCSISHPDKISKIAEPTKPYRRPIQDDFHLGSCVYDD